MRSVHFIGVAVLLALQFVTLCRVTHVAHAGPGTCVGLVLYVALGGAFLWGCRVAGLTPLGVARLGCLVQWIPLAALMVFLSRGARWRALFVAFDYVAYATAILPICHVLAFRQVGAMEGLAWPLLLLVAAHAVFLFGLLPRVPRSDDRLPWRLGCLAAFVLFLLLYATGIWPHSLVTGGWRDWAVFLVASAAAWVVFPMMYAGLRLRQHSLGVERSFSQMASEFAVRREAIDAVRRQRHDARHHRIVIAECLLRGHVDQALDYLEQLDREADRTPTDKFIWCENDMINAILSGLSRRAKAKGVALEVTANVEPKVNLPDVDVVAVIGNLVENAINAAECEKVAVALRQRERTVGMTVTNPVPADFALSENGLPCQETGIGLESVARAIERHHGELAYALKGGILECRAMMRIEDEHSVL